MNKAYETIDGKPAVVITGIPYPNVTEQLAFDRETGLLLQRRVATGSGGTGFNIMNLAEQIDYSDYRDVARHQGAAHGPPRDLEPRSGPRSSPT